MVRNWRINIRPKQSGSTVRHPPRQQAHHRLLSDSQALTSIEKRSSELTVDTTTSRCLGIFLSRVRMVQVVPSGLGGGGNGSVAGGAGTTRSKHERRQTAIWPSFAFLLVITT